MFTTRVELHNAQEVDYLNLHPAMEIRGFSRTITSDDRKTYEFAWAEYDFVGTATIQQVFEAVMSSAASTGRSYAVLVSESSRRMWHGLPELARR